MRGVFAQRFADDSLEAGFQAERESWTQEYGMHIFRILALVCVAVPVIGMLLAEAFAADGAWWFHFIAFIVVGAAMAACMAMAAAGQGPAARIYLCAIVFFTLATCVLASFTRDRLHNAFSLGEDARIGGLADAKSSTVVCLALSIPALYARIPSECYLVMGFAAIFANLLISSIWGTDYSGDCSACDISEAGFLDRVSIALLQSVMGVLMYVGLRRQEQWHRQYFAANVSLRKGRQVPPDGLPAGSKLVEATLPSQDGPTLWQPPTEAHNMPNGTGVARPNGQAAVAAKQTAEPVAAPAAKAAEQAEPAPLRVPDPAGVENGVLPFTGEREHAGRVLRAPNALLVKSMAGKKADWARIKSMAAGIRRPDYKLRAFFDDCSASFPELGLFFVPGTGKRARGGRQTPCMSGADEYQRTVGALFTVYWLLRLDVDGKSGFCYGVDKDWSSITPEPPVEGKDFFKMTPREKRASFLSTMEWSMFAKLVRRAGCEQGANSSDERIMALLCLTAFHDIMKLPGLRPIVQPAHSPYYGYEAGVRIHDHDVALSYVLEHFPDILPSYAGLSPAERKGVLFTQGKMQFNHGWFVQGEAPPGGMLSKFKAILEAGAEQRDIDLYFLHWVTDLAGASATPLGGAEKFVLAFPQKVLEAFLWSMPYLRNLASMGETELVEQYLEARWSVLMPSTPVPEDSSAIGLMRLALMAQAQNTSDVVTAFKALSISDQSCLITELARTGCSGQFYKRHTVVGGPAFLVYYAPALLQKNNKNLQDLGAALHALCVVLRGARALWPHDVKPASESLSVIVQIEALKVIKIEDVMVGRDGVRSVWVLLRENDKEGTVTLCTASELNALYLENAVFRVLDFTIESKHSTTEDAQNTGAVQFLSSDTDRLMARFSSSASSMCKRIMVFTDMSTECDDECAILWLLAALNRRPQPFIVELVQTDSHVRFQWMSHIFANKLHPGGDWEVVEDGNAFITGNVRVNLYLAHSPMRETMVIDELCKKNPHLQSHFAFEDVAPGKKRAVRAEGSIGGVDYTEVPGGRLDAIVVAAAIPDVDPKFFDRFESCKCAYIVGTPGGVNCPMPSWRNLLAAMHRLCPILYLTPQFTRTIRFPKNYVSMNPDWTDTIRHTMWDAALTCMARRPEFPPQVGNWGLVLRLNAGNAKFCEEWFKDVTKKQVQDYERPAHLASYVQAYVDRNSTDERHPGVVRDELRNIGVDVSAEALGLPQGEVDSADLSKPSRVKEVFRTLFREKLYEKVMVCVLTTEVLLWGSLKNKKLGVDDMGFEKMQARCGYRSPTKDLSDIFGSEDALKLLQQLPLQKLTPAYDVVAMICADAVLEDGVDVDGGLGLLTDFADETMGLSLMTEEQRNLSGHAILMTQEQKGDALYSVGPFG